MRRFTTAKGIDHSWKLNKLHVSNIQKNHFYGSVDCRNICNGWYPVSNGFPLTCLLISKLTYGSMPPCKHHLALVGIMQSTLISQIFKWISVSLQYLFEVASSMSYHHTCLYTSREQRRVNGYGCPDLLGWPAKCSKQL